MVLWCELPMVCGRRVDLRCFCSWCMQAWSHDVHVGRETNTTVCMNCLVMFQQKTAHLYTISACFWTTGETEFRTLCKNNKKQNEGKSRICWFVEHFPQRPYLRLKIVYFLSWQVREWKSASNLMNSCPIIDDGTWLTCFCILHTTAPGRYWSYEASRILNQQLQCCFHRKSTSYLILNSRLTKRG